MKMIKKLMLTISTVALLASGLTACHTVQGAGQDISSGGQAITRAAS